MPSTMKVRFSLYGKNIEIVIISFLKIYYGFIRNSDSHPSDEILKIV